MCWRGPLRDEPRQHRQQLALRLGILGDRLDDQVAIGEIGRVGGDPDPRPTRRRRASSPSPCASSSARPPEASLPPADAPHRAGRAAARPQAIVPLPATRARVSRPEPLTAWLLSRPRVLRRVSAFAAGPRTKWVVIAAWVVIGFAPASVPAQAAGGDDERERGLPAGTPSRPRSTTWSRSASPMAARSTSSSSTPARGPDRRRPSPDQRRGAASPGAEAGEPATRCSTPDLGGAGGRRSFLGPDLWRRARSRPPPTRRVADRPEARAPVSEDGSTALLLCGRTPRTRGDPGQRRLHPRRRYRISEAPEGELRPYLTGIAGIVSDSIEVFESIDTTLLLVTVTLVLVLLLAIYRSPVIALVPLFVVAIAYGIAAGARLRPRRGRGRRGQRPDDEPADRPDVRRRHRLLPADRLALPRGAAAGSRTSTRRWARDRAHGAGDPLGRRDRRRGDARLTLADLKSTQTMGPCWRSASP